MSPMGCIGGPGHDDTRSTARSIDARISTVARSPLSRGRAEGMNRSSAVRAARRLERCSVDCGPGALMAFSPVVRAARMRQGWVELPTGNDSGDYPTRVHVPWPGRTVEKLFPIKWIGQEITDRTR